MAPAPGRIPTTVPTTEQRSRVILMLQSSLKEGIFVLTLPLLPTPSSAERRFLVFVCFSTSVTANRPISTGIISMPDRRLACPNVRRATPAIGSCPIHASRRPIRPEIIVVRICSVSSTISMLSPRNVMANMSPLPKARAALLRGVASRNMTSAENRPPIAEASSATPRALPASPRCAIGYPSKVVGADEGTPGILNRIAVIEPPVIDEQ